MPNWKLIVDPALKKGSHKVYRNDGVVTGVSIHIAFHVIFTQLEQCVWIMVNVYRV